VIQVLLFFLAFTVSAEVFELKGRYIKADKYCYLDLQEEGSLSPMRVSLPCDESYDHGIKYKLLVDVGNSENNCVSKVLKSFGALPAAEVIPRYSDYRLINSLQECRPKPQ
jgi:hypothetical protein